MDPTMRAVVTDIPLRDRRFKYKDLVQVNYCRDIVGHDGVVGTQTTSGEFYVGHDSQNALDYDSFGRPLYNLCSELIGGSVSVYEVPEKALSLIGNEEEGPRKMTVSESLRLLAVTFEKELDRPNRELAIVTLSTILTRVIEGWTVVDWRKESMGRRGRLS